MLWERRLGGWVDGRMVGSLMSDMRSDDDYNIIYYIA